MKLVVCVTDDETPAYTFPLIPSFFAMVKVLIQVQEAVLMVLL